MEANEISILTARVPKKLQDIEREIGMPDSTLRKSVAGHRPLPKKWWLPLKEYCEKHTVPVITEVKPPEPVAVKIPAKKAELSPYLKARQQSKLGKKA
jgi:hypothetical protein